MAEFSRYFLPSLSAVSIDNREGGWDRWRGGVGWDRVEWDRVGWMGWDGRWQKPPLGTPHEQP